MQIQCPHCGATGRIPDSKIVSLGAHVSCPKCKQRFPFRESSESREAISAPTESQTGNDRGGPSAQGQLSEKQMKKIPLKSLLSNLYSVLIGGAIFAIAYLLLNLSLSVSVVLALAGYGVAFFLIFPPKKATKHEKMHSSQKEAEKPQQLSWGQRHIPLLIFLATLSGSLLGAVGSFSEALNLLIPLWKIIHPSPQIRVVGSNTILGHRLKMADEWLEDFQEMSKWQETIPLLGEQERKYKVNIDPVGSVAGIQETIRTKGQKVNVLAASEPIPPEAIRSFHEKNIDFHCAAEIGYDLIVFVTDKNNPSPILSKEDIQKVLTGKITDWSELGTTRSAKSKPIVVFARKGSGTTDIVLRAFTGSGEFPKHFVECENNAECLNQALGTPGSLYWVSLSWLYTQPPDYMQVVLIQAQENMPPTNPYEEGFNPTWYPSELIRPLYMYVLKNKDTEVESLDVAEQFFHYVRGVRGQKTLEQHNFYTYFQAPGELQPTLPEDFGRRVAGRRIVCR